MNFEEEYSLYLQIRNTLPVWGSVAPYDWVSQKSWQIEYMAYSQMLDEHAREIANSINELQRYIYSMDAWSKRLFQHESDDNKFDMIIEFIDPIATISINLPYVIRSRLIYSIAHLCHQANQAMLNDWKDEFPIDSEVYFAEADKYGMYWSSYKDVKLKLEKIANKKYTRDTCDFRNAYNHRYSPKIEYGLTNLVTRSVSEIGAVRYGFGQTEPLKLEKIIELLKLQHSQSIKAFECYRKLIEEQIMKINFLPSSSLGMSCGGTP